MQSQTEFMVQNAQISPAPFNPIDQSGKFLIENIFFLLESHTCTVQLYIVVGI